jgi:hypothetical protein
LHVTPNDYVEEEGSMRIVQGVFGIVAVVTATAQPIGAQETSDRKAEENSKPGKPSPRV